MAKNPHLARAKKEVNERIKNGAIDEQKDVEIQTVDEGDYVRVYYGNASFQYEKDKKQAENPADLDGDGTVSDAEQTIHDLENAVQGE